MYNFSRDTTDPETAALTRRSGGTSPEVALQLQLRSCNVPPHEPRAAQLQVSQQMQGV